MNYWYPLNDLYQIRQILRDAHALGPHAAAIAIVDLPLCVVRVNDAWGLALTGGGMDLSWEIAAAYVALGYLPPTHFRLPAMCGRGSSARDRFIISAYRRSCQVQIGWLKGREREVAGLIVKKEKRSA